MNDDDKKMFQQMSSSTIHNNSSSCSTNDQDELIQRRKLEQKRRFQQKQGNTHKDVDSLMQSMFSDLKLQTKSTTNFLDVGKSISQISEFPNSSTNQQSPSAQTNTSVPGAADWSKIAIDDDLNTIFYQHENNTNIPAINSTEPSKLHHSSDQSVSSSHFVYPSWCSQPIVFLPLVYQQVFEASHRLNVIDTSILYPILILSGLRQDQLSQIWSQVNLTQPGVLIKEELFMALALIGLAQNSNGQIFPNDHLYHLNEIPLPHFQIQEKQPSPPPPPPPVYQQENFADFTTFTSFESIEQLNIDHTHVEFDENQLCSPDDKKPISSDTQSLTSLDFPIQINNTNHHDDIHQKGNFSDNISHSSSNNNETTHKNDTQSLNSINSSEPSKLELTQFSFFSDDTSENDSHITIWLRCFEKCYRILSQANEIFSSIERPSLCSEVLQQTRARDYVYNLQEIFHVHKRIYTSAVLEPTTTSQLTSLWKQIVVLWTNLQSFFLTAHLHLLNDDDIDYSPLLFDDTSSYCSLCLLSTTALDTIIPKSSLNTAHLTFAGRSYHASCANFYLNLIDGILPSLRKSS